MKAIFLIITSILLISQSYAQSDSSLLGSWKLVALSNPEMYFDINKDSFFLSKATEKEMGNIEAQKQFKEMIYSDYVGTSLDFERNGLYKYKVKGKLISDGSYENVPYKNTIKFKTKNGRGQLEHSEIKYELKNNRLWVFFGSNGKMFDFLLEKN